MAVKSPNKTWKILPGSQEEAEIIDKYLSGVTMIRLASEYGVAHTTIQRLLIRTKTPIRRRGYAAYQDDGLTYEQRNYQKLKADPDRWKEHLDKSYTNRIQRQYGITREEYDELERLQRKVCAICRQLPKDGKRLRVDHDHTTGAVRGLLCNECNRILGLANDKIEVLEAATFYLIHALPCPDPKE